MTYTVGGNATPGNLGDPDADYQPLSGSVTFAPGSSTTTVTISSFTDTIYEALVNISAPDNGTADPGKTVTLAITPSAEYGIDVALGSLFLIDAPTGKDALTITGTDTYYKLTGATKLGAPNGTVMAGDDKVTVTAYVGGKLDVKIADPVATQSFAATDRGITIVASSSSETVVNNLKWLQFSMRDATCSGYSWFIPALEPRALMAKWRRCLARRPTGA